MAALHERIPFGDWLRDTDLFRDVESKLTRTALTRTHETLRKTRSDEKK